MNITFAHTLTRTRGLLHDLTAWAATGGPTRAGILGCWRLLSGVTYFILHAGHWPVRDMPVKALIWYALRKATREAKSCAQ